MADNNQTELEAARKIVRRDSEIMMIYFNALKYISAHPESAITQAEAAFAEVARVK